MFENFIVILLEGCHAYQTYQLPLVARALTQPTAAATSVVNLLICNTEGKQLSGMGMVLPRGLHTVPGTEVMEIGYEVPFSQKKSGRPMVKLGLKTVGNWESLVT